MTTLVSLALITLVSHLLMTITLSPRRRTYSAPLYLALRTNLNPIAMACIATVGMNYCLALPASSKALLVFQDATGEHFQSSDLAKLSGVMFLVHLLLILAFSYGYWRFIGLEL